jgi:outer membrane protein assembly factor BamB
MQSIRVHGSRLYLGTPEGELIVMNTASGAITATAKVSNEALTLIEYAGDDVVLVSTEKTMYGLGVLGNKKWEYSIAGGQATYFNGVITVYTSPLQLSALSAQSGKLLWKYDGSRTPYVVTTANRFFILGEKGVKEYSVGRQSTGVTDKETLTELARAYLAKGDLEQAGSFLEKASNLDGNYPPAALVRARLLEAQRKTDDAGQELLRYAGLVGIDSTEGQRIMSELKRDYRFLWETTVGPNVAGDPVIIGNRLVSVGRRVARESQIIALDLQTGAPAWQHTAEVFVSSVAAVYDRRFFLWYSSGVLGDESTVMLHRIDAASGEVEEMAKWRRKNHVDQAWIAYASGRIFVADRSGLQVSVECFDAGTGARLWNKEHTTTGKLFDLTHPVGVFAAENDSLTYSVGTQKFTVRAGDGSPLPPVTHSQVESRPSGFVTQNGHHYTFTGDGHAYAMK